MRLAIIGATGHLGAAIAQEATARGHEVTALGRATADITDAAAVADAVNGHDAVVASVKGPDRLVPAAPPPCSRRCPSPACRDCCSSVAVEASSNLGTAPRRLARLPPEYLETALDQAEALDILRHSTTRRRLVVPEPAADVSGARRQDRDIRSRPPTSRSSATTATAASPSATSLSAVLDAIEDRSFVRQRFTVGY